MLQEHNTGFCQNNFLTFIQYSPENFMLYFSIAFDFINNNFLFLQEKINTKSNLEKKGIFWFTIMHGQGDRSVGDQFITSK